MARKFDLISPAFFFQAQIQLFVLRQSIQFVQGVACSFFKGSPQRTTMDYKAPSKLGFF
jgi:hypothetical protein